MRSKIMKALFERYGEMAKGDYRLDFYWSAATQKRGWHYMPFGGKAQFLGKNAIEAIEFLKGEDDE